MNLETIFLKHGYEKKAYCQETLLQKDFADTCAIVFVGKGALTWVGTLIRTKKEDTYKDPVILAKKISCTHDVNDFITFVEDYNDSPVKAYKKILER